MAEKPKPREITVKAVGGVLRSGQDVRHVGRQTENAARKFGKK
jgi:hypothetical protein